MFHPRTSSYTAIRGYHCAISYSALSRPIRSAPCSGTVNAYGTTIVARPPRPGTVSGKSRRIIVSSTRGVTVTPSTVTAPSE